MYCKMIYDKGKQPYRDIIDNLSYEGLKHALRFHYNYEQKYGGHIHPDAINNINYMHVDELRHLVKLIATIDNEYFYFVDLDDRTDEVEEGWWFSSNPFGVGGK